MNLCTKCGSYYVRPGTCNCYANATTQKQGLPHVCEPDPFSSGMNCKYCGRTMLSLAGP